MTDKELLIEVRGVWGHLPRAEAVKMVAAIHDMTVSGVSGRVTRAELDPLSLLALANHKSRSPGISKAERRSDEIVWEGLAKIGDHPDGDYTAVFVSDIHVPEQEDDALEIFLSILADLPNVRYVSALNDALDFSRLSQWPERRSIKKQQLDHDFSLNIDNYGHLLASFQLAAPGHLPIAIIGNHDARAARFGVMDGAAEVSQTYSMERLAEVGVVFTDKLLEENIWSPAPGVYWMHGLYAGQNLKRVGEKNYAYVKKQLRLTGDFTLIMGHVHRAKDVSLERGGRVLISGCMHHNHPAYIQGKAMWDHAFVITSVIDGKVFNDLVMYEWDERGLYARWNNKLYRPVS